MKDIQYLKARITELEKIEDDLNKVYDALNSSLNGVIITNMAGKVVYANPSFLRIFGYEKEEMVMGRKAGIFFEANGIDRLTDVIKIIETGEGNTGEFIVRRKDGSTFPVEVSASTVTDRAGNVTGRMASFADITKRREAEDALKKYARDLEEANRLKDLFTDILRHDLLNPADVVQNFTELLMERVQDPEDKKYLERIQDASERLIDMIETATLFSKLQEVSEIKCKPHDLNAIVRECLENLEYVIKQSEIEIDYRPKGACPSCVNSMVSNIFTNLITNVVKYAREGKKIEIDILDKGNDWVVYFKDWGEGITDADKGKLFSRFERLGKEGTTGKGLGLAIVKRIVELHKGKVWVEDNPEGGAVFLVRLPKEQVPPT